jgi:hypothetical protein
MTATTLLVVPKSIPIGFAMVIAPLASSARLVRRWVDEDSFSQENWSEQPMYQLHAEGDSPQDSYSQSVALV